VIFYFGDFWTILIIHIAYLSKLKLVRIVKLFQKH